MTSENQRIVKNSAILYIRMLIVMGISIYSSRLILNVLGITDYGIYNVVGGVVAMFSFLNASMSTATSRFLTIALSKNNTNDLKETFSAAITTHLIVALIVVLLAETIGLWLLENKLVIPSEQFNTSRIIYQFSIICVATNIIQVPYNALIIAHEKLNIFALGELTNSILKLLILFLLPFLPYNKLLVYAGYIMVVSISIAIFYRTYCKINFKVAQFSLSKDKKILSEIFTFSGWDLYGNMSVMARTQGVNMLLNMFYGPVLNAASGIAGAIQGAIGGFASNVMTAVRPQILKRFGAGKQEDSLNLMFTYIKFSFLILSLLTLPLILNMDFILRIWLINPPAYCAQLCILTLLFNLYANVSLSIMSIIHATGKIKKSSLVNGTLYLSVIPITYVLFKYEAPPYTPYILNVLFVCAGFTLNSFYLKKEVPSFSIKKLLSIVIKYSAIIFFSYYIIAHITTFFSNDILGLLTATVISIVALLLLSYIWIFSKTEKEKLLSYYHQWKLKKIS